MQRSSAPGPSRRWSPASLDRTMFDAGVEQLPASQYDYACTSMTTTTVNASYPYATQPGHTNYAQTTGSSHFTNMTGHSSSYQYPSTLYPASNQPDRQIGASYQSNPAAWSSSAYYGHSAQASVSYSSNSAQQYASAAASSSSQTAPKAKLQPSRKLTFASRSTASTSHARSDDGISSHKAKMAAMTGRARLPIGGNAHIEAVPQSSGVGDKRKDRASSPPGMGRAAEASPVKRKKEALRVKDHRKNRTEATAELAKRLPSHLQVYEAPSVKHIRRAIIHIDEQSARIGRLENELSQSHSAQVACAEENKQSQLRIAQLTNQNLHLRSENFALVQKVKDQECGLIERDNKIIDFERRQARQYRNL